MTSSARIIVIGTGAAGASAAYAMSRRGFQVVSIESGAPGQATAAGAGIIEPWSRSKDGPWYRLSSDGARYYPILIERLLEDGIADVGYSRTGGLVVSEETAALDEVESRLRGRTGDSPEIGRVSRLSPAESRELFPPLAPGLSAVHIAGAARVDGRKLRLGLLQAAARRGATSIQGTAELALTGSRASGVRVNGENLDADCVVIAAGAWTNELLRPVGRRTPVEPQRGQIVHLRMDGTDTSAWPSVLPLTPHYMVCFGDSRIAVGATRETGSGFDPRVTAGGQRLVLEAALAVAPGLADASYLETRVGLRPLSADQRPHLGLVPGIEGLAICTGFGAGGLTMGPQLGEALADLIEGKPPATDLTAIAPRIDEAQ